MDRERGERRGEKKNRFECNRIALKISTTVNPPYVCYDAMYGGGYLCVCVHARTRVCVYDKKKIRRLTYRYAHCSDKKANFLSLYIYICTF